MKAMLPHLIQLAALAAIGIGLWGYDWRAAAIAVGAIILAACLWPYMRQTRSKRR